VGDGNGADSDAMRRLAESLNGASAHGEGGGGAIGSAVGSAVGHVLAGMVVLGVLIAVWRTVMRNGGPNVLRDRFHSSTTPAAPRDPGVIALCELMASLERRLARVEIHVTSREFDLNRKFREIDAGRG
jgi:hypothetical protein